MQGLLLSIILSFVLTQSLVKAQFQTGDVVLLARNTWYVCSANPTNIASYSIMTYNQSVAPTPNFGSTRNDAWIDPDKPPCTQSFVSVVVDPTNYAKIFDPKSKLFYAWDAQSCITTCVDTCMKTDPLNSPQAAAWCIVVSNPNNGATAFLRISYTFDPTAFISTSIAGSTSTVSSTSIGSSTAITSSTSTDTHAGIYTATIQISSNANKIGWNSILSIWLAIIILFKVL